MKVNIPMRIAKQITTIVLTVGMLSCVPRVLQAQNDPQKEAILQKLQGQFTLTKITNDRSDIVTPGSVLVLNADGLVMYSTTSPMPPLNTYKNGKISHSFGRELGITLLAPGNSTAANYPQRKFVSGEKFWITGCIVQKTGIDLLLYSDPYNDVRFYAQLNIPFAKGSTPSPEDAWKMVSEAVTPVPPDAAVQSPPVPAAPAPQPAPEPPPPVAMAPIAPPPPPADAPPAAPKTISLGQTKDQVVAIMGQPDKVANLGTKEIDYYADMKVTFVKSKVTDIQ